MWWLSGGTSAVSLLAGETEGARPERNTSCNSWDDHSTADVCKALMTEGLGIAIEEKPGSVLFV